MALSDHPMWRRPRHHLDLEQAHDHVHWVELFYDLVQVVLIFLLGNYLSHHLDLHGFLVFAGLFIAIWAAWADSGLFNSFYVSTDVWHRIIMAAQIVTAMVMGAAIPDIDGSGLLWFFAAYAVNRAITALMYVRAIRPDAHGASLSLARVLARNYAAFAVLFAIAAFLPQPWNVWLFAATVAASQLQWVMPRGGLVRMDRAKPRTRHLNERFDLLMLIVLGEGFFKLVVTLSEKGLFRAGPEVLANFAFGGFAVFILTWIYFDFAGNGRLRDTRPWTLMLNWYGHLALMLAGVVIGVALAGEVKVGFWEPYDTGYAALGCFGLAAYVLVLGLLQGLVEDRVAHRFACWDVKLIGAAIAVAAWFIIPHVPSLAGNLIWGFALVIQIAVPVSRAYLTFRTD